MTKPIDYDTWFNELYLHALDVAPHLVYYIQRGHFMYEDYWHQGMTPKQGFEAEWGDYWGKIDDK